MQQYRLLKGQAEVEGIQKIRTDAEAAAVARLQQAYGKHYNTQLARESQQDIAAWLGEATQPASIRKFLHRAEQKTLGECQKYRKTERKLEPRDM